MCATTLTSSAETEPEIYYEPPHFEEHNEHPSVHKCWLANDGRICQAFPATEDDPLIFKITDPELAKQLTLLNFPGRYKKEDLPVPVQAQLQSWSGLQVDAVVTARHLKCYMNLPVGVVATRRTTLARVSGEWFYIEHNREIQGSLLQRPSLGSNRFQERTAETPSRF
jgi:hypothetical protein